VRRRLVPGEESRAHRALAECLPRLPETSAAEVAAHWQAVGDTGAELEWRIRAASEAAARFAGRVAADHWSRVLGIWPPGVVALGSPPLTRPEVWHAVLDACDLAGDLDRGDQAAQQALAESGSWRPVDRAELLRRAGHYRSGLYDLAGAHRLLDEAIDLYRRLPPSEGLAQALDIKCHVSNRQGHHREAVDLLQEALQVLDAAGGSALQRELLASIAWQDSVTGHVERAVDRMAEVALVAPAVPEPRRDLQVAVMHTDILLKASRPPEEVEAAAAPGLAAIEAWGLENLRGNLLRANVALAWMRAGRLERAAEVLVATAPDEGVRGEWGVHLVRARVDCALGQVGLARERCAHLLARRPAAVDVLAPVMAELELWDRTVDDAFDPLVRACAAMPNLLIPGEAGDSLVLAARAAAELAARSQPHGTQAGRQRMARRLADLLQLATHDPFAPTAVPVDRHAGPQWDAELARLVGSETVAVWQAAAEEWDAAHRPHDAAYCRWRAARVALRDADQELADRLLRRAARDAREHEPLSTAIRATSQGA
jgi:tetratricopeptide (TPR) repeat protein